MFYYHQARLGVPCKHAQLRQHIRQVFRAAKTRYGHRRVRLALIQLGIKVSRKLVAKFMAQEGVCLYHQASAALQLLPGWRLQDRVQCSKSPALR